VRGQFVYSTNDGVLTIIEYTGSGGAITIPNSAYGLSVTSIGEGAFEDCNGLVSATIGTNVTSIGENAFAFCYHLTSITFPASVTSIGQTAFSNCLGLTNITIGASVTNIGYNAFMYCPDLTSVTIAAGVTSIGESAFYDCSGLTIVTIPASVTNIGHYAFMSCPHLTSVYFKGNAPAIGWTAFDHDKATVYYLPGTTGWGASYAYLPTVLWNPRSQVTGDSFSVQSNPFGFAVTGSSNITVVVEATTDLANPDWLAVSTNTLTSGSAYFTDPQWTNYPSRFYRLRSP
jgi:hypothetical protein